LSRDTCRPINTDTDALVIVDLQPDFMPGGALPVAGGDELATPIAAILPRFSTIVATQDWHPTDHLSFASSHGKAPYEQIQLYGHPQTLWPNHCIQGTAGARLDAALPLDRVSLILRKGADRAESILTAPSTRTTGLTASATRPG
jgi:nicotinamidase/pyrazinamidase